MADKPQVKDANKAKDTSKPVAKPRETVVNAIRAKAATHSKDRADLVQKVLKHLADKGVTKNSKGRAITEANVTSLLGAMVRDIVAERGKGKDGWWSKYTVEETDTAFRFVAKPQ